MQYADACEFPGVTCSGGCLKFQQASVLILRDKVPPSWKGCVRELGTCSTRGKDQKGGWREGGGGGCVGEPNARGAAHRPPRGGSALGRGGAQQAGRGEARGVLRSF